MKIFVYCLFAVFLSSAFAVTKYEENIAKNEEGKNSNSKPRRNAPFLVANYYGPSYKYLPPSSVSSSFNTYPENNGPSFLAPGVYNSVYRPNGWMRGYYDGFAHVPYNGGSAHDIGYVSKNHGLNYASSNFDAQKFVSHNNGIKGGTNSLSAGFLGHKEISNPYALGHRYSAYENDYKAISNSISGGNKIKPLVSEDGYQYTNAVSSNIRSSTSNSPSPGDTFSGLPDVHHFDLVHNGGQKHIYTIPNGSSNFVKGYHEVSEYPTNSYISPVQQHAIPSSNYDVPIKNSADIDKNKYHPHTSLAADREPNYAAGHKGLRHFSFTANKPQALHTSISSSSKKQHSFSKAPFKPSTFLGVKYEENLHENVLYQQNLPSLSIVSYPTNYNYPTSHDIASTYQQEDNRQSLELESSPKSQPDLTYLSPISSENSFNEISFPNGKYLSPTNTKIDASYSQ